MPCPSLQTEMENLHITLLMSHFQEHEDGLLLHEDVAASATDIEKKLNLPASPRPILLGMEEHINAVTMDDKLRGPCFLRFVGINPERSSKTCRGKVVNKKSDPDNPKVASLLKNIVGFEWDFIQVNLHIHTYLFTCFPFKILYQLFCRTCKIYNILLKAHFILISDVL